MTALWLTVVALIALALALILPPLFTRHSAPGMSQQALARRLYADQLAQLERDQDAQALNAPDRAQAIEELQRDLLEETSQPAAATHSVKPWMCWGVALGLSLALPTAALLLYQQVGDPRAAAVLAAAPPGSHEQTRDDMDVIVARLATRLQAQPADLEGWMVLARSYEVMQRYDDAVLAYRKAIALAPDQAQLLADYADALGSARQGDLGGPAQEAIDAALALDPQHPKALALAGMLAYQRGDTAQARSRWETVRNLLPPDSEGRRDIEANLAQLDAPATPSPPMAASHISGTVAIAPELRNRVGPQATVFVLARATSGGRMPVAVLRLTAKDLPARFVLDDSLAMTSDRPLSRFDSVTVEVRVSASGQAALQSGDLYGTVQNVVLGQDNIALLANEQEK
ncbi:c-type cytochrome biogenesis protein CcmI [Variovorax sp. HJSM1_2]|uniref:c-type cytochrome biogenesis protein CcmI n=1 Tax=Variovorax sp. HJSM1_2 TaxID=3366263 RepID=UPI003BD9EBC1